MKHELAFQPLTGTGYRTAGRRQLRLSRARRISSGQSGDRQQNAACGAAEQFRDLPGIHRSDRRAEPALVHSARLVRVQAGGTPVPLEEVEPASEIVKRFATGAMSFGSISQRGARDSGHRHEPHRRTLEYGRGRGRRRAFQARPQRRSAAQFDQAGGFGPFRRHRAIIWSTPTICRSRWRRAPSPARAASCPATRWMKSSRACATPCPAWV